MSQSFSISHGDFTYELEYSDFKNKQLSKLCKKQTVKYLETLVLVFLGIFALVFAYDYFKDTARNISVTKDLVNSQFSWMKLFGFTKGNITRTIVKYSILILSFLFFYLSTSMAKQIYCITDAAALQEITKNIVYENNVPVKFV